ncbi:trichohyalin, partial [Reticulomyxa filosa]
RKMQEFEQRISNLSETVKRIEKMINDLENSIKSQKDLVELCENEIKSKKVDKYKNKDIQNNEHKRLFESERIRISVRLNELEEELKKHDEQEMKIKKEIEKILSKLDTIEDKIAKDNIIQQTNKLLADSKQRSKIEMKQNKGKQDLVFIEQKKTRITENEKNALEINQRIVLDMKRQKDAQIMQAKAQRGLYIKQKEEQSYKMQQEQQQYNWLKQYGFATVSTRKVYQNEVFAVSFDFSNYKDTSQPFKHMHGLD